MLCDWGPSMIRPSAVDAESGAEPGLPIHMSFSLRHGGDAPQQSNRTDSLERWPHQCFDEDSPFLEKQSAAILFTKLLMQ